PNVVIVFFFSSRRRHTRLQGDWSSDVCSSDLDQTGQGAAVGIRPRVRFWMSHTTSFDIAPGMVVLGSGAPGFSGHAGLNIADYVGLTMHVVALRPERFDVDRSTRVAVFAGGRLAS